MTRTYCLVVNPAAGGGRAQQLLPQVNGVLDAAGVRHEACSSTSLEHAKELAAAAAGRGDVVVAFGGDGMVGALAGTVARASGTLGIIPAGRGNDFARTLGIPFGAADAARVLARGRTRRVDLIGVGRGDADGPAQAGGRASGGSAEQGGLAEQGGHAERGELAEPGEQAEPGGPAERGEQAEPGGPGEPGGQAELGEQAEPGGQAELGEQAEPGGLAGGGELIVAGSVYLGIPAVAAEIAGRSRVPPGELAYPAAALRAVIGWRTATFRLKLDGGTAPANQPERGTAGVREFAGGAVVVANSRYFGAGMMVAPEADPGDGLLDVVYIQGSSKTAMIHALTKIKKGTHVSMSQIGTSRARTVTVTAGRPIPGGADGELLSCASPLDPGTSLRIRVLPSVLQVMT